MLVPMRAILAAADKYRYGQGAFNMNSVGQIEAAVRIHELLHSGAILQGAEASNAFMGGELDFMHGTIEAKKVGAKRIGDAVKRYGENSPVPIALHLDHGTYEGAKACVAAGFTSIMFDGSHYSIDENVAKTTELVALAHDHGLSIEAEVGSIGGEEDGVIGMGEVADPAECAKIASLGIDFLAAGIGNIHGKYPANWKGLDFVALDKIHNATDNIPLVLHGGTGIPDEMIKKAISLGVSKINVNTECQLSFADATRKYIEAGKDLEGKGFDPRKLLAPGAEAIKATVREKIELFGSANKA